ncbi:MAG TPA: tripartite tricarboxylate transporter substrate-binding protein [Pseudolabrys sp.]|nr:tripartite tricarboxylate transporter substrate-binding protein [Pseudolabrys sp.]
MNRRAFSWTALCLAAVVSSSAPIAAQAETNFPTRTVRIISPFAAGGPTDSLLRIMVDKLKDKWKQTVIIENKPGAGTMVGTSYVARAQPDGYTIGYAIGALTINQAIRESVPYDLTRDFEYVTQCTYVSGYPLVANANFPANTLPELIALAKKSSPPLMFASPGPGTNGHMMGLLLARETGTQLQHVPYNGSAPALIDVLAGRVPLMFDVWISVKPYVDAGKLKVIALANTERMPGYNFPTIGETVPGAGMDSIQGFIAPAGTPKEIVDKIARDIGEVVNDPATAARIRPLGFAPVHSSPAQYKAKVMAEFEQWKRVSAETGLKLK